ncbi:MAG: pseudaminic acid cytidylyltransferase [Burkholderiales bacterium]
MKIAVIPARGGSKRIPRKNIRPFAGKPIIAYSIEAALAAEIFDKVLVSTDDDEIAAVSRAYGAEVPFVRPAALSDDHTGTNAVAKHAITWAIDNAGAVTHACCIYATAPFLQASRLRAGFACLVESGSAFAFSVTTFPFPIQRAIRIGSNGTVEPMFPEHVRTRSQDLEQAYHDAGQFYWGTAEAFLNDVETFSAASTPVILPRHLVQDIDTEEDWHRAELLHRAWRLEVEGQRR